MSQQQPESFLRAFELPLRKTQAHNLALAVGALLERRRCTITQPARALPDGRPCHRIKRIWRFLDNQRVNPLATSQRLGDYVGRWRAQGVLPIFADDTGLRRTRLTTTDHFSWLLMVVTLASWWLASLARRIAKAFEALVRGRAALSFVSLGLEWLRRRRRKTQEAPLVRHPVARPTERRERVTLGPLRY